MAHIIILPYKTTYNWYRMLNYRWSYKTTYNWYRMLYVGRRCQSGVTCGALVAHRYTDAPTLCWTSQFHRIFLFPCQYLCGTILMTPIRWCGTDGFQQQGQCLFICLVARSLFVSYCVLFLFFQSMGWYRGAGVFGLLGCYSLSLSLAL